MSLRWWKAKASDFIGSILYVLPVDEIKVKNLIHPIKSIKRSYAYSEYSYDSSGGWNCHGRPGEDCPECETEEQPINFCIDSGCDYHIYHKPFTPWVGGFLWNWFKYGIPLIIKAGVCFSKGHRLHDCSTAGPDSGNMDHECIRCGRYWSVPLY